MLWISGPALVIFTAAVLWGATALYRDRIATIALTERRFLTTEWRLLQELKARTDRELVQKDQQIADLNRLYLELIQSNAPPARRQQLKNQIDQAEAERAAILSRSISSTVTASPATGAAPSAPSASGSEPAVAALLAAEVERLQAQLESSRALVDALDRERDALISNHQESLQRYSDRIQENEKQIRDLSASLARMRQEVAAAVAAADRRSGEAGPAHPLDIQDLKTQALVRALVDSPQVRAAYPGLLESLDHFLDVYGLQQRQAGEKEAYGSVESILAPLASDAGAP